MPVTDPDRPVLSLSHITAPDVLTCTYLAAIGLLVTVFAERVSHWWWYPLTHALLILALGIFLATFPPLPTGWTLFVRWWYPVVLVPPLFNELQHLVH